MSARKEEFGRIFRRDRMRRKRPDACIVLAGMFIAFGFATPGHTASQDDLWKACSEGTNPDAVIDACSHFIGPDDQSHAPGLAERQNSLQQRLDELKKELQQLAQDQAGLKDAQKAMQEAEKSLTPSGQQGQDQQGQGQQQQGQDAQGQQGQQGQQQGGEQGQGDQGQGDQQGQGQSPGDSAVAAQGRALEGLRKGAEQLAQAMQQGQGQGQQPGDQSGEGQAEGAGDQDPLGRPMANDPALNPNARLNMEGLPAAERAQRVLEELRRRLADPWRSKEELDYLERLLKPY